MAPTARREANHSQTRKHQRVTLGFRRRWNPAPRFVVDDAQAPICARANRLGFASVPFISFARQAPQRPVARCRDGDEVFAFGGPGKDKGRVVLGLPGETEVVVIIGTDQGTLVVRVSQGQERIEFLAVLVRVSPDTDVFYIRIKGELNSGDVTRVVDLT